MSCRLNNCVPYFLFVLLFAVLGQLSRDVHAEEMSESTAKPIREEADKIIAVAKSSGIQKFNETMRLNGWKSPLIYSKWKIDVSTNWPKAVIECRMAQRDAGREIARMLTRSADILLKESSAVKIENIVEEHFLFIDWMSKIEGYGNLLLLKRAQDIVVTAVIRLAGDMSFPLERADSLVLKISEKWHDSDKLYKVYKMENAESKAWDYASAKNEWMHVSNDVRGKDRFFGHDQVCDMSFCSDDSTAAFRGNPHFPENIWENKFHERIFIGYENQRLSHLKDLMTFRRVVGGFPIELVAQKRNFDLTPISSAFRKAWEPYALKKLHDDAWASVGSSAEVVYYALITGMLMPEAELEEWRSVHKERLGPAFQNMVKTMSSGNIKVKQAE